MSLIVRPQSSFYLPYKMSVCRLRESGDFFFIKMFILVKIDYLSKDNLRAPPCGEISYCLAGLNFSLHSLVVLTMRTLKIKQKTEKKEKMQNTHTP